MDSYPYRNRHGRSLRPIKELGKYPEHRSHGVNESDETSWGEPSLTRSFAHTLVSIVHVLDQSPGRPRLR